MKKIIFYLTGIAFLTAPAVYAQSDISRPKHEINIGLTDLFKPDESQTVYYYPPYYYNLLAQADLAYYIPPYQYDFDVRTRYGLGYKFHLGKNALRLNFAMGMQDGDAKDDQASANYKNERAYSTSTLAYRIGYERTVMRKEKFDLYLAADFIMLQADYDNKHTQTSPDQVYVSENNLTYKETGAGLSLGARYFVHENISFSTETRIDYVNFEESNKNSGGTVGAANPYVSKSTDEGSKTSINPLAIFSVNVHF